MFSNRFSRYFLFIDVDLNQRFLVLKLSPVQDIEKIPLHMAFIQFDKELYQRINLYCYLVTSYFSFCIIAVT